MLNESMTPRPLEEFRPYLMVLARSSLGRGLQQRFDASDVVQNALLNAHRSIDDFRGHTPADQAAWLRQILANCIAEARRRNCARRRDFRHERSIEQQLGDSSRRLATLAGDDTTPSDQAIWNEKMLAIARAIRELRQDQHDVVLLRHVDGLPFGKIAEQLNRSYESIIGLHRRAVAQLRCQLMRKEN